MTRCQSGLPSLNLLESAGFQASAFASGSEFLESLALCDPPDCLILDVRLAGANGLEFQQQLSARRPFDSDCIHHGAWGYPDGGAGDEGRRRRLSRQAVPRSGTVGRDQPCHCAWTGGGELAAEVSQVQQRFERLTPREREVMQRVVRGLLNKQIASELGMSETTVKVHRGQVMRKMQADSLPDLVRMAEKLASTP